MEVTVTPDSAPPPAPVPTRRGLSRRWLVLIAVVVLLLATAAVYGLGARRRARVVTVDTPAVAGLRALGDAVPISDGAHLDVVETWVAGDRAIAIGQSGFDTWVAAKDLKTGRPSWPPRKLGNTGFRSGIALPQGIAVLNSEFDEDWLVVVDPATGRPRWQAVVDPPLLAYADEIVVGDNARGMLRGLDWDSGQPHWLTPMRTTSAYVQASPADGPVPEYLRPASLAPTDERLFEVGADGTVTIYDARTGERTGERPAAVPARAGSEQRSFLVSGNLLLEQRSDANQVIGSDLAAQTGPRTLYSAASPEKVNVVAPCGQGRVCVDTSNGEQHALVLVDTATGHELWRRPTIGTAPSGATGDHILAPGTDLFDAGGQSLLSVPHSLAAWAGPKSLLLLEITDAGAEVAMVDAATGARSRLGVITDLFGGCALTERVLACAVQTGLAAWQFGH